MKIALFGYGYWGKIVYKELTALGLSVMIVDPTLKDLKASTQSDVLKDSTIQHCFIVTPEASHFKVAQACLQKNKHVFVEKPLCLKGIDAQKLIFLSQHYKQALFVDYTFLYDEAFQYIQRYVQEKNFGSLVSVRTVRHSQRQSQQAIKISDDLVIHDLYILERLFDSKITNFEILFAQNSMLKLQLLFEDSRIATGEYVWSALNSKREITLKGETGELTWDKTQAINKDQMTEKSQLGSTTTEYIKKSSALSNSVQAFLELSKHTFANPNLAHEDYLRHVRILEGIHHACPAF